VLLSTTTNYNMKYSSSEQLLHEKVPFNRSTVVSLKVDVMSHTHTYTHTNKYRIVCLWRSEIL